MTLDTHRKATLIAEVDALVSRVRQQAHSADEARKVLDMTNLALAYLRGHTPEALRLLLDVPHATTTVQSYWQTFGGHLRPILDRVDVAYQETAVRQEVLLYFLGWLHRVRLSPVEDSRRSSATRHDKATSVPHPDQRKNNQGYRTPSRPAGAAEFSVKLGSLLNQPATPSSRPAPNYKQGDKVKVTVVTTGINGVVRLPDDTEIRSVSLIGSKEGATITVRIIDVTGDGRIKRVVR